MAPNNNRREATRRQLESQLRERQIREAKRKRVVLISSITGTLVVIAAIIVVVYYAVHNSNDKSDKQAAASNAASSAPSPTPSAPTSTAPTSSAPSVPKAACTKPDGKATASFDGVTVGSATDLKHEPKVRAKGTKDPTSLTCMDLVTGKGKPATDTSSVTVQYTGVLYKDGKEFDSSWARGKPTTFSLTGVVPGFTQGIGGAGKAAPMRVGGRRIMILPPALGYGSQGTTGIPANSTLVFVVDLLKVT